MNVIDLTIDTFIDFDHMPFYLFVCPPNCPPAHKNRRTGEQVFTKSNIEEIY
jgi:hypothetical protein